MNNNDMLEFVSKKFSIFLVKISLLLLIVMYGLNFLVEYIPNSFLQFLILNGVILTIVLLCVKYTNVKFRLSFQNGLDDYYLLYYKLSVFIFPLVLMYISALLTTIFLNPLNLLHTIYIVGYTEGVKVYSENPILSFFLVENADVSPSFITYTSMVLYILIFSVLSIAILYLQYYISTRKTEKIKKILEKYL